jgi:heterodisulfide reductase subunit A
MGQPRVGSVKVVGGGILGMQTALDLANSGYSVCHEERSSIGGVMAQLDKTFNVLWVMKRKALP